MMSAPNIPQYRFYDHQCQIEEYPCDPYQKENSLSHAKSAAILTSTNSVQDMRAEDESEHRPRNI